MAVSLPKIIFEDDDMLVLDKPAGWVVTNENRVSKDKTIEDWVGEYVGSSLLRNGIVHRLDKGTSGIVVVAKNEDSLNTLKRFFKNREVVKHYLALVCGDAPKDGSLLMPIGRSRYVLQKFSVREDGKPAFTEFKTIKKIKVEGKVYSLLEINLKTGRTHQIRVHMSYLGWPLLGDRTYGAKEDLGLNRPFLHARYLKVKHPKSGRVMEFNSELATDLSLIIEQYS